MRILDWVWNFSRKPRFRKNRSLAARRAKRSAWRPQFEYLEDRLAPAHALNLFELDGNALDSNAANVAPDDWNSLFPVDRSPFDKAKVFANDLSNAAVDTGFIGGGSKDDLDVTEWQWVSGEVTPDKDDITNAYAAAYTALNGDVIVYFGADRLANNGDAAFSFWFFQDPVALGSGGVFTGKHALNDILVQTEFTNGGAISRIELFKWVGSGGSDGPIDLVASGAECSSAGATDILCGEVNTGDTPSPWPYEPKFGAAGTFPQGSFFEGGINLTKILGIGTNDCFTISDFMAETRTSQSVDAVLKDFVLGDVTFSNCGTVRIVKNAIPNHPQDFAFSAAGLTPSSFSLDDDPNSALLNSRTFTDVLQGTYRVTEADTAGWSVTSVVCTDPDNGSSGSGRTATIDVDPNETVTCVFTNTADLDAQIDLTPATAVNEVNESHVITATVLQRIATDDFTAVPAGTLVTFSLRNDTAGASFVGPNTCLTVGTTGKCNVTIISTSAGIVDIHAATTVEVGGKSLVRETNGTGGNSFDAKKRYVNALIELSPLNATNAVNRPHVITAFVKQDDGLPAGAPGGDAVTGFGPAGDKVVTFSLRNNTAGADFVGGNTCTTTDAGRCTITINSSGTGSVDVRGATSFTLGGELLERSTGATGPGLLNGADAHKVYVNARIGIGPNGENPINTPHTFTISLERDLGDTVGFRPFAGQTVSAAVTRGTCTFVGSNIGVTDALGKLQVTINSPIAQTCVVEATFAGDVVPGDHDTGVTRTSDPDATKVYFALGRISGSVYEDRNNNGIRDTDERGIPGVTVNLNCPVAGASPVAVRTTTNTDGVYVFRSVPTGIVCSVTEQPQTQFPLNRYLDGQETKGNIVPLPNSIGTDTIPDITVLPGQEVRNNNFGERPFTDLLVTKTDGRVTAVPGAFDVYVIQVTNRGPHAVQNAIVRDDLPAILLNATWTCTASTGSHCDAATGSGDIDTTVDLLVGGTARFRVTGLINPRARGTMNNRVCVGKTPGGIPDINPANNCDTDSTDLLPSISGIVYDDRDNDGLKDSSEVGIPNITVQLFRGDTLVSTTRTNSNGGYQFRGVAAGTYIVREPTQPTGFLDGKETKGNIVTLGNSTVGTDLITGITVAAGGQDARHNNFGELRPSSLSGFVYIDADGNGVFEPNSTTAAQRDTTLGGVRVTLTGTNDLGRAVNVSVISTIDNGYRFSGLRPGTYVITETQPPEFLDGRESLGTINGVVRGTIPANDQFAVPVRPAENGVNYNFGELRGPVRGGRLSGFVYVDANNNGVKESTEAPISGVTVILTGTDVDGRSIRLVDTTDARGFYEFFVDPGVYVISEVQPTGFNDGKDSLGSLGGILSNDRFSSVVIPDTDADIRGINYNFGELRPIPPGKDCFFAIDGTCR